MEGEGFVSLWLVKAEGAEELESLLTVTYTEDGDSVPCAFARLFEITAYDEDVREIEYFESPGDDPANIQKATLQSIDATFIGTVEYHNRVLDKSDR